jgi:hypothetical protein
MQEKSSQKFPQVKNYPIACTIRSMLFHFLIPARYIVERNRISLLIADAEERQIGIEKLRNKEIGKHFFALHLDCKKSCECHVTINKIPRGLSHFYFWNCHCT